MCAPAGECEGCVLSVSPGLCCSCHVSPIGHGLYLERRSLPNSMGGASERREPGRKSTWRRRCAASGITRPEPVVTSAEGEATQEGETPGDMNPNTPKHSRHDRVGLHPAATQQHNKVIYPKRTTQNDLRLCDVVRCRRSASCAAFTCRRTHQHRALHTPRNVKRPRWWSGSLSMPCIV